MNQAIGHPWFCQLHPTNKSAESCWISIQSGWNRKEKELLRNAEDVDHKTFLSSFKHLSLRLSSTLVTAAKRALFGLIIQYLLYFFMFLFHSLCCPCCALCCYTCASGIILTGNLEDNYTICSADVPQQHEGGAYVIHSGLGKAPAHNIA